MWPFSHLRRMLGGAKTRIARSLKSSLYVGGENAAPQRNQRALAEEGYKKNAIGYRAISAIARGAASVPWTAYIGDEEVEDHPVVSLLNTRANPWESGSEVQESIASFYLLTGNAYPRIIRLGANDDGAPRELYSLRPERVEVIEDENGMPGGYKYRVKRKEKMFRVEIKPDGTIKTEVWHFKTFNPLSDLYGMAPLEAAAYSVDQHNAGSLYNYNLLKNHARPSGIFSQKANEYATTLSDPQFEKLQKDINDHWSGPDNAGKAKLIEGGLEWQETSWSPRDVDWVEGRNISGREIAQVIGMAPMLAGIMGDATYANYAEANRSLWESTINGVLSVLMNGYNAWLTPMYNQPGLRVQYDLDEVPAIAEARRDVWEKLEKVTFLTYNEKREVVGYDPVDGGDTIYVPGLSVPLGELDEEEEEVVVEEAENTPIEEASKIAYGR